MNLSVFTEVKSPSRPISNPISDLAARNGIAFSFLSFSFLFFFLHDALIDVFARTLVIRRFFRECP